MCGGTILQRTIRSLMIAELPVVRGSDNCRRAIKTKFRGVRRYSSGSV